MQGQAIFVFNNRSDISDWQVVLDGVMGGKSAGNFALNEAGKGAFNGIVSLENNGGFASVRYRFKKMEVQQFKQFTIRLKGDGKQYQFRVKSAADQSYAYVATFETTGEWQTVTIPFGQMSPQFRGRKLDMPNYAGKVLEEASFLIGNKKNESFELVIDRIELCS